MNPLYVWLALAWVFFCLFHSLLAAPPVEFFLRARLGRLAPWYRLLYNLFAIVTVAPAVYMEKAWAHGPVIELGQWEPARQALFWGALLLFGWVILYYNGTNISGLSPSPGPEALTRDGEFRSGGPLAYVRHPLYSLAFILLWTRPVTDTALVTNIVLCIYIFIGVWLEEQKLSTKFGAEYSNYKQEVPAFLPVKLFHRRRSPGPKDDEE